MNKNALSLLLLFTLASTPSCVTLSSDRPSLSPNQETIVLKGTELKGTSFNIVDEQGKARDFQISDIEIDPEDPAQETYLYTVLYRETPEAQWQNLCEPDVNHVAKAIPLKGSWDPQGNYLPSDEIITFGCTSGALGKCVRFGYKPWKTVEGRSLRELHQACVRMVRADYCGNGRGHTRDGTPIDVYDRLKIQTRTPDSHMTFEAAWGPDGAVFVNRTRWGEPIADLVQECRERLADRVNQSDRAATVEQIQQQYPKALLFNDSYLRATSP